jgi:hypothetical protein
MSKQEESESLTVKKKYTFNRNTKKLIFHTEEKFGSNLVFSENKILNILKLYSNFDKNPHTITDIEKKTNVRRDILAHILKCLNKTHDSLPFIEETVEDEPEEKLVNELVNSKEFSIQQKFEKADWKKTQEDADKWRSLQFNQINPVEAFLENWVPPVYKLVKTASTKKLHNKELIIGASDWHYGLVANERFLYNQKEWNIEETKKTVDLYASKLILHLKENSYRKLNLCFLGDLSHTLNGYTDKGTKLEYGPLGEEQLEQAFNSMLKFVNDLLSVHSNIEVFACSGNHSALGDYVLVRMLELYFRSDKRIKFNITNKRNLTFKVYRNLFLMEHGYSSVAKSRLPAPGKGRETYINNLFMCKPELMKDSDRFIYLSADQHHSETYELTNVEGYMFPTLVGGCRHADNSGYKSRPRQTCLVVEEEGITSINHFFFD